MAVAVPREEMRKKLLAFLESAAEEAGGAKALALELTQLGFTGQEGGPVSVEAVRAYLRGARRPTPEMVFAMAAHYRLSLDQFVFGEERQDELTKRLTQLEKAQNLLLAWASESDRFAEIVRTREPGLEERIAG